MGQLVVLEEMCSTVRIIDSQTQRWRKIGLSKVHCRTVGFRVIDRFSKIVGTDVLDLVGQIQR